MKVLLVSLFTDCNNKMLNWLPAALTDTFKRNLSKPSLQQVPLHIVKTAHLNSKQQWKNAALSRETNFHPHWAETKLNGGNLTRLTRVSQTTFASYYSTLTLAFTTCVCVCVCWIVRRPCGIKKTIHTVSLKLLMSIKHKTQRLLVAFGSLD